MHLLNAIVVALVASSSALAVTHRSDAIHQRRASESGRSLETHDKREPVPVAYEDRPGYEYSDIPRYYGHHTHKRPENHPRDLKDTGNALKEETERLGYLMAVLYHLIKDSAE